MRYWSWLVAKLAGIALFTGAIWAVVETVLPPHLEGLLSASPRLGVDLTYTVAVFTLGLLAAGLLALCAWDQRFRCRSCGRRLRMPQAEGVFSSVMLGGVPHTEYICTFGHGTLYVPDVHTTYRPAKWTRYANVWDDLRQAEEIAQRR